MRSRLAASVAVGLGVLLLLAGCSSASSPSPETKEVLFLFPYDASAPNGYGVTLALHLGYFEGEGLDLTIEPVDGGAQVNQQVVAGRGASGLTGSALVVGTVAQGFPLKSYFQYAYGSIYMLGLLPDSPIQEVADLEGKIIGFTEAGGGEVSLMRAILIDAGLDPDSDVELVAIGEGGPQSLEAIESGRVDAYMAATNDLAAIEAAGLTLRTLVPEAVRAFPATSIIADPDTFEAERETFVGLGRGMAKAMVFAKANPEAAEKVLTEAYPEAWSSPDIPRSLLALWIGLSEPPAAANGQYGWTDPAQWGALDEYLAKGAEIGVGQPAERPDLTDTVDSSLLDELNDFDHAAVEEEARNYE